MTNCEVITFAAGFGGKCEQQLILPENEIVSEGYEGVEKK
jgi:hypothetical protein